MASIAISDIRPVGQDLFFDTESFMADLNENELDRVVGGTEPVSMFFLGAAVVIGSGLLGYAVGSALR
jgi:hypothetical protein